MADTAPNPHEPMITPLVKGLTRMPTILGVPYPFFMLIGVVTAVVFLVSKNLLLLLVIIPLYALGRIMVMRDPAIFDIVMIRSRRTPPRGASLWGARSYRV